MGVTVEVAVGVAVTVTGCLVAVGVGDKDCKGVELAVVATWVEVRVGDHVGVPVGDAETVRVGDLVTAGFETVGDGVRVGLTEDVAALVGGNSVDEGERVGVGVGDTDRVRVLVTVGDRVAMGEKVRVDVGRAENVCVGVGSGRVVLCGVGVRVGVKLRATIVRVAVRVGVGVLGSAVGVGVGVGERVSVETGTAPIRKSIWAGGPKCPPTSRTRTVSKVSPNGKAREASISAQNCTVVRPAKTKRGRPNSSIVHARGSPRATPKPQLAS
ncbi:MAG: hypothetical protein KatS3mg077_3087 [Candidatus Binatia bacterium]|nr:MAG: hypothetical protein KatS3mg077_3087 [Candidatus Binatia bacterium]